MSVKEKTVRFHFRSWFPEKSEANDVYDDYDLLVRRSCFRKINRKVLERLMNAALCPDKFQPHFHPYRVAKIKTNNKMTKICNMPIIRF